MTIKPDLSPTYIPKGMPTFKVGMRVRVRLSGECEFKCPGCGLDWHLHIEQGGAGVVKRIVRSREIHCNQINGAGCNKAFLFPSSHSIAVYMDPSSVEPDGCGGWFCRQELEKIDED